MPNCFKYFLIYILGENASKTLDKKNCQKNYIKSLCAKFLKIFSNIYFEAKCLKKLDKKSFELYQISIC